MATAKKAVAKTKDSMPSRPSYMKPEGSERGNEGVSSQDMTIPRLSIIQDLSPQHKKSKPEYIEGAEVQMIFNTATQKLYGKTVFVVPVLFRKEWVIWKDVNKGGGFKGSFATPQEANDELASLEDAEDCEVVDTAQHFVLIVDEDGEMEQAVISMSKSQMKVSRKWNTSISAAGGDRFERMYRLEVVEDQNKNGQEYYNWKVSQMGYVEEEVFRRAEKMYEAVRSGAVDVKRDSDAPTGPAEGEVDGDDEF